MIIDCHGHYTTVPDEMNDYRAAQLADLANLSRGDVSEKITDDQLRESLEGAQIRLQRERGTDMTIFSPRASAMAHHLGCEKANIYWAEHWNNLIYRICQLYPEHFAPVGMLPSSRASIRRTASPRSSAWSTSSGSSASTSTRTRQVVSGPTRPCSTSGGTRSTRRWPSSTCRRWCTSPRRRTRPSTSPARTTSTRT